MRKNEMKLDLPAPLGAYQRREVARAKVAHFSNGFEALQGNRVESVSHIPSRFYDVLAVLMSTLCEVGRGGGAEGT